MSRYQCGVWTLSCVVVLLVGCTAAAEPELTTGATGVAMGEGTQVSTMSVPQAPSTPPSGGDAMPGASTSARSPTTGVSIASPPRVLTGATVAGEQAVRVEFDPLSGDQLTVADTRMWSGSTAVSAVIDVGDSLLVSVCCEPAAATVYRVDRSTGEWDELGYGLVVDGDDSRTLTVDSNGAFVLVSIEDDANRIVTDPERFGMPVDAAFMPDGRVAVVTSDQTDDLHVVGTGEWELGDSTFWVSSTDLGGRLDAPFADAAGAVHVTVTSDAGQLRAVVTGPGLWTVEPVEGPQILDQDSDAAGRSVVTAYADGVVTWRRIGDATKSQLDVPAMDRVNW